MNNKQFERAICGLSNFRPFALDERTRALRTAGLLPYGARGPHAPQISPDSAAKVLISLASEDAKNAPELVLKFWSMVEKDGNFLSCSFGETLADILTDLSWKCDVSQVSLCRTFPMALITLKNGEITRFGPEDQPDSGFGFAIWSEFVLSEGFLHQIACDLAEKPDKDDDWTVDVGGMKTKAAAMEAANKAQEGE